MRSLFGSINLSPEYDNPLPICVFFTTLFLNTFLHPARKSGCSK